MKKLSLLLAVLVAVSTYTSMAQAFESPLKKYSLYDDVMKNDTSDRDNVMGDYAKNSLANSNRNNINENSNQETASNSLPKLPNLADLESGDDESVEKPKRRNEILRESSKNVYFESKEPPVWTARKETELFYKNPSLNSIILKYRKSDFAGCMQESEAYVRKHPSDTLGYYYLAMSYTKVSDKDNAIAAYEKVISLNSNPMIVKYATNGRNCIMGNDAEQCFENVNIPELIYPYKDLAESVEDLTPVDPEELITNNLVELNNRVLETANNNKQRTPNKDEKVNLTLPFGNQDEELDKFINAPYGNGLSPELNNENKQNQLKQIQQTINKGQENNSNIQNYLMKNINKLDNKKSDSGCEKLAYDINSKVNDSIYDIQRQEYTQMSALLGIDDKPSKTDMFDILPQMMEKGDEKLSPEFIQTMMLKTMMSDITL